MNNILCWLTFSDNLAITAINSWETEINKLTNLFLNFQNYRTEGVRGSILVNRKASCYIQQEDCHHTLITIQEMMTMACRLKLKQPMTRKEQQTRIDEILTSLSLQHRKSSTASTLSGGERKRLSIALELVTNPDIMFLDEPTSGLDEVTAASCIRLLRRLAHENRTIICTIHQPSTSMFDLFDDVYLLAQGQCVYQGSPRTLLPFMTSENFICPKYNNPADYSKFIITFDVAQFLKSFKLLQSLNFVISNQTAFHTFHICSKTESNNASQWYQVITILKILKASSWSRCHPT